MRVNVEDYVNAKGLIFDCDGTIADTMPAHYVAWREVMGRYGIEFGEDRFYALGGVPTVDIVALLSREQNVEVDVEAVSKEKEEAFHEFLHEVGVVAPVVGIAERYRGEKPMAVATGTERWSALRVLNHLEIFDWFDALVCSEEVARPKPAPDVFLEAAKRIGVAAEDCVVFEDTDLGLEGGREAGMRVVDVRGMYEARRIT